MNRKSFIKNIAIVGGILAIATILLTGCGKKKDETKTYDKENEVAQNIVSNQNYASNLSTEEKIKIAYYLRSLEGDYSSVSSLSTESIISTLTMSNLKLVNAKKTVDKNAINMFNDYDSSYCEIYVIEEADVKKAAKDLFDVELTDAQSNFKDAYLKRVLKYNDGKYYFMKEQAAGESLTIKNISNEGDTYTFFALSCLDSDEKDLSEYYKYEVVITDGVIKSCREAMETEQEENKKAQTQNTNTTTTEENSKSSAQDWKTAYTEKIKSTEKDAKAEQGDMYNNYENNYSIYDLNKDGIPELFIYKGTCEADWMLYVYTYKNNSISKLAEMSFSHSVLYIMNGENYLKLLNGHMGYEVVSKIYMNSNGELIKEKVSERELAQDEDYESGDKYLETYAYGDLSGIK